MNWGERSVVAPLSDGDVSLRPVSILVWYSKFLILMRVSRRCEVRWKRKRDEQKYLSSCCGDGDFSGVAGCQLDSTDPEIPEELTLSPSDPPVQPSGPGGFGSLNATTTTTSPSTPGNNLGPSDPILIAPVSTGPTTTQLTGPPPTPTTMGELMAHVGQQPTADPNGSRWIILVLCQARMLCRTQIVSRRRLRLRRP